MASLADTIFALASGRPPAAIAVIRISGPQAHAAAARLAGELPPARTAALRRLRGSDGALLDEALVLRFHGPASPTGENVVEFQCHGGRAVVEAILLSLAATGMARLAEPGEFTRRAFANGRIDLTEAEGLADLLEAETERQRRFALDVATGGLRTIVEGWRERLIILSAQAEAAIDYVGDEEETGLDLADLIGEAEQLAEEWRAWLDRPSAEPLREGIRVVVAGPPNAGKSSLVNALAGSERAIVTPIPGTTRDTIEVPLSIEGIAYTLIDTAGQRDSDDPVERIGVERALAEAAGSDILLWLGSAEETPVHRALIMVAAKADLGEARPGVAVSATTGEGLGELVRLLRSTANRILPAEGLLALNRRQRACLESAVEQMHFVDADLLIAAESLRSALAAIDRLSGRSGMEDMLDALFARFCLGK